MIIKTAAKRTDTVIADVRSFPSTIESRISLDALSFAAKDLAQSPGFESYEVMDFWRNALLDPIFTKGSEYIKDDKQNESTLNQLVLALQRGIGTRGTGEMVLDAIAIVGPNPPESVMKICESDSLVFRKVYDLLVYSRSLQEMGPPVWMMTGPWLLAVAVDGWPLSFYCLKPLDLNGSFYLTFRNYTQGQIYASVYNDPAPRDNAAMDAWFGRASAALDTLKFGDTFAAMVKKCDLPTYGAHNYFGDYLLSATADTVKKEFTIIFKRESVVENTFQYAGVDSIAVLLTQREIISRADTVTPLAASHYVGDTMVAGRYIPAKSGKGMAFLMPVGVHDEDFIRRYREAQLPKIQINGQ